MPSGMTELGNSMQILPSTCTNITSKGIFFRDNPLNFSFPLLTMQIFLASGMILFLSKLLRPLAQPPIVSQILAGIILGPSVLGSINIFDADFFPLRGLIVLDTFSRLGFIFYFFLLGLRIDLWFIIKTLEVRTFVIGLATLVFPMGLSSLCATIIKHYVDVGPEIMHRLVLIAVQESVMSMPTVAQYLADLKIINSEFGRVALSSALCNHLINSVVNNFSALALKQESNNSEALRTASVSLALILGIVFILRPVILLLNSGVPKGQRAREQCICAVCIFVMMSAFVCQAVGLNITLGPIVLGLALPPGPPIGTAIIDSLDPITNWVFMPLFFVKSGLGMDIFGVGRKQYFVVQFIILSAWIGKFLGAFLPSVLFKMPLKDAAALGLVMIAQGVVELNMFNMMKKFKAFDNDEFVVMCTSIMIVTGIVTPIIKYLQDPSKRYVVYKKRTVMHLKSDSELRTLVCIHNQENVPAIINLYDALTFSKQTPVVIYVLHLVELINRTNPVLFDHKSTRRSSFSPESTISEKIINEFRFYERNTEGTVSVHPFTSNCPYSIMHDDVFKIAQDRKTSLIIIPFQAEPDNTTNTLESSKKGCKILKDNVLNKAPCSVAILIDRGLKKWSSYRVAVLFLGGSDDREALSLGRRMANHPKINLTMIRLLDKGDITYHDFNERKLDNESISDFRRCLSENYRVIYIEEVVINGSGTVSVIQSMENNYELIMVGRRHSEKSSILSGITDWNEDMELGVMGGMLASDDFQGNSTVLVVQQHSNGVKEVYEKSLAYYREPSLEKLSIGTEEEAEDIPIYRRPIIV